MPKKKKKPKKPKIVKVDEEQTAISSNINSNIQDSLFERIDEGIEIPEEKKKKK